MLRAEMAIKPEHIGTKLFDAPIVGFGAADDPLFDEYKKPGIIGPWHMSPCEWLDGAQSVVSLFFPMSEAVRVSNRRGKWKASDLWAYARIEGQDYINAFMAALAAWFAREGVSACVPSSDPRWKKALAGRGIEGFPEMDRKTFTSRWSERHAAYVCGLGTFGLSRGLITEKGMAGRFGSVLVTEALEAEARHYTGVYDYCIRCGACVKRCPARAIDLRKGKNQIKCGLFVKSTELVHRPRYGCGLCQTKVPCETRIPILRK